MLHFAFCELQLHFNILKSKLWYTSFQFIYTLCVWKMLSVIFHFSKMESKHFIAWDLVPSLVTIHMEGRNNICRESCFYKRFSTPLIGAAFFNSRNIFSSNNLFQFTIECSKNRQSAQEKYHSTSSLMYYPALSKWRVVFSFQNLLTCSHYYNTGNLSYALQPMRPIWFILKSYQGCSLIIHGTHHLVHGGFNFLVLMLFQT